MLARGVVSTVSAMAWCMIERGETKWHVDGCNCRLCEREEMVEVQRKGGGQKLGDLIEQAICYQGGTSGTCTIYCSYLEPMTTLIHLLVNMHSYKG